ncbi:protein cereblon [Eurytemora carolleeae]|uniref:protein cereblon n=1 Tax=Eurytemora carolleeae TaxID=1294199 RepID=UPI000C78045F|nr:protein cereblon [Eurytemora carolleeae]|eukprot:XP_023335486.1 protein cereblon-like [Eurytemora affinis]
MESSGEDEYYDDSNEPTVDEVEELVERILMSPRVSVREDDSPTPSDNESGMETYDRTLPGQHSYLGSVRELSGRTILDENEIITLPLVSIRGFVLMPGQIFPLTLFHPSGISQMRTLINSTKTFGVITMGIDPSKCSGEIGTTAEVFEYQDVEDVNSVEFKIKARGRQRFKVVSVRRQINGTLEGSVIMISDNPLPNPLGMLRLKSSDRQFECDFIPVNLTSGSGDGLAAPGDNGEEGSAVPGDDGGRVEMRVIVSYPKKSLANLSPFPTWVYQMYETQNLVSRVRSELGRSGMGGRSVKVPMDPEELSWWVAANLPLLETQKSYILSLKSIVQRLRAELSFLTQCRVLVCSRCSTHLANQSDIFSMSEDGPQAAFVNLGGHLHETLTLYQARNLKLVGTPSTEYSWFPGYAWTILECGTCHNHIGWKFTAAKSSLKPVKFYGFSGKSIIPTIRTAETGVPADGGIRTDLADLNSEESGVVVI